MKTKTPELSRIIGVSEDSQRIGEFLEWLAKQEIVLAEWTGSDCSECGETLMEMIQTTEQLLANYFEIDLVKAEKERQALLDEVKAANAASDN